MDEKNKMKHTVVIYAINGEHITIDCEDITIQGSTQELRLYKDFMIATDEKCHDLIAAFQLKNIIGWEQIR